MYKMVSLGRPKRLGRCQRPEFFECFLCLKTFAKTAKPNFDVRHAAKLFKQICKS